MTAVEVRAAITDVRDPPMLLAGKIGLRRVKYSGNSARAY